MGHLALFDLSVAASLEDADDTGASLVFRQRLADLDYVLEAIIAADARHTRETTASILEDKRDAAAIAIFFGGVSVLVAVSLGILTLLVLRSRTRLVEAHGRLLADRASELEAYAGRVAHDLRTPLAAMMLRVRVAQAWERVEATTLDTRVEPLPTLHVACTLARSAPEILVQPERSVLS